ncbi:Choline-sulfatase [Pigmentiphaga humi]|uniref:Choline-sulfatase n=1 Tax=Pigmentiphaga humi TaxID=2478468 RepID=A0A3P4AZU2_9BURK|nr:sulfatase-like hydrolase/transferase [Pigmentiphaga humi]VCU68928.1 Choline-sulfatase [Pigmentiphaga humi]
MSFKNVLILMSDEHAGRVLGCAGHPLVRTPNIDRLAASGTRFSAAYTNSPICIPARAAFATGRYPSDIDCWDNATPYGGHPPSWGHALREAGIPSFSIGKLHYRNAEDDTGFTEQILPMHVVDGVGDVLGSVRDPLPVRTKSKAVATEIGPGESSYTEYDRRVTDAACGWLKNRGRGGPWTLFVGWVAPHFPLIAPRAFYDLYDPASIPLPKASAPEAWPAHPWLDALRECFITDRFHTDETRRIALASYLGLVSFMDDHVGRVLAALDHSGAAADTLVIYASDHGDNMGARGLWGKSTMYEESAGIPMILSGGGIPSATATTPVSLVDVYPTLLHAYGLASRPGLRGASLIGTARDAPRDTRRAAFAEYHAAGAASAAFMIRQDRYKYVHYVGMPPQLFDLAADPEELDDLAGRPEHASVLQALHGELLRQVDPVEVDRRARAQQQALVARHGGRDAVVGRGGFGATPPPGHAPKYA